MTRMPTARMLPWAVLPLVPHGTPDWQGSLGLGLGPMGLCFNLPLCAAYTTALQGWIWLCEASTTPSQPNFLTCGDPHGLNGLGVEHP